MSLALDAIIIVVALVIIITATRKGLIRAVMGLCSSVASLIVAYAYTPVLSAYINQKFLLGRITSNISETLKGWSLDTATDLYNLDRLVTVPNDGFNSILDRYGVKLDEIAEKLRGLVGVSNIEVNNISEEIAAPTSNILANVIAFILIFAATFIVLALLTALLNAIFKIPVLSGINRFFGFVFGVIEAVVVASVLAIALSVLVKALGAISPSAFGPEVVNNSIVCKFLTENNVFLWINKVLGV